MKSTNVPRKHWLDQNGNLPPLVFFKRKTANTLSNQNLGTKDFAQVLQKQLTWQLHSCTLFQREHIFFQPPKVPPVRVCGQNGGTCRTKSLGRWCPPMAAMLAFWAKGTRRYAIPQRTLIARFSRDVTDSPTMMLAKETQPRKAPSPM